MKLKILRNTLVSIIITKIVKAAYIFEPPSPKENKCFEVGKNSNDSPRCTQFKGYYLPQTDKYSDYSSFSSFVSSVILNDDTLNRLYLEPVGCSANASSIDLKEEMFCSYVIYDSINNNRCSDNNSLPKPSNYICTSKCLNYMNQLKDICPANTYSNSGVSILEELCGDLKNCGDITKPGSALTETISNSNEVVNPNTNIVNNSTIADNISNNAKNNNIEENNLNTVNNDGLNQNSGNGNGNSNGNGNGSVNSNNNTVKTNNDNDKFVSTNGNGNGVNKNILYTIGFMVPVSIFVGFGLIIYYNKKNSKIYESEKELHSSQYSSKHSYSHNNTNRNSMSSNVNGQGNHQKNVPITIPLTNKNIEEQDNMATNRVAELISTATMINAANHANNNIQPITPKEVNLNINTRYNTLNSNNTNTNTINTNNTNNINTNNTNTTNTNTINTNTSNSNDNRKLPSFIINKIQDSPTTTTTTTNNNNNNNNISVNHNSSLKPNFHTQINPLSTTSPDSESSPMIDMSIYGEQDPLLHIKESNSFYHSSVSSESKKYNSFISPVSPIISEKSLIDNTNDGKEERKSYTNHLLTKSILVANDDNEEGIEGKNKIKENKNKNENENENENNLESIDDENIPLEEENTKLRPSKIFSTDISVINNTDGNNERYNNGISITIDDADESCRSSKYSSAKIPLSVMTVVQEFEPRMDDELSLQMNDRILLLKIFDDGWAVGLNQMTGKQGVFPMEYVVASELIASNNKFASQIEYRNVLPSRTQSQAFSNLSFSNTTINDSVIRLTDIDFDTNSFMSKSQSMASSKYYSKSLVVDGSRKSRLNNSSIIED
jgi:hypothetical protein